jgi:hypothetical protein
MLYSSYISIMYFLNEIHKFIKCYSCALKVHVWIGISLSCLIIIMYVLLSLFEMQSEYFNFISHEWIQKSIKCLSSALKVHVKNDLSNWYYFHVWLSLYAYQHKWVRYHKLLTCPIRLWQIFIMVHSD